MKRAIALREAARRQRKRSEPSALWDLNLGLTTRLLSRVSPILALFSLFAVYIFGFTSNMSRQSIVFLDQGLLLSLSAQILLISGLAALTLRFILAIEKFLYVEIEKIRETAPIDSPLTSPLNILIPLSRMLALFGFMFMLNLLFLDFTSILGFCFQIFAVLLMVIFFDFSSVMTKALLKGERAEVNKYFVRRFQEFRKYGPFGFWAFSPHTVALIALVTAGALGDQRFKTLLRSPVLTVALSDRVIEARIVASTSTGLLLATSNFELRRFPPRLAEGNVLYISHEAIQSVELE